MRQWTLVRNSTLDAPLAGWFGLLEWSQLRGIIAFPLTAESFAAWKMSEPSSTAVTFKITQVPLAVTVHPTLKCVALLFKDEVQICRPDGSVFLQRRRNKDWGEGRAISFDATGRYLLATYERTSDWYNSAQLFSADTLELLGSCELKGDTGAAHYISAHPSESIMIVDLACGQDGCWMNVLHLGADGVNAMGVIDNENDPSACAGFSLDGKYIPGIGGQSIRVWSYAGLELVKYLDAPEERNLEYCAAFWADKLAVCSEDEHGEKRELQLLSVPELELCEVIPLPFSALHSVTVLPDGYLETSVKIIPEDQKRVYRPKTLVTIELWHCEVV